MSRVKYGVWLPIFGGWLHNVEDENCNQLLPMQRSHSKQTKQ
nr:hypothetical protein [Mesobacillus maritimus]